MQSFMLKWFYTLMILTLYFKNTCNKLNYGNYECITSIYTIFKIVSFLSCLIYTSMLTSPCLLKTSILFLLQTIFLLSTVQQFSCLSPRQYFDITKCYYIRLLKWKSLSSILPPYILLLKAHTDTHKQTNRNNKYKVNNFES